MYYHRTITILSCLLSAVAIEDVPVNRPHKTNGSLIAIHGEPNPQIVNHKYAFVLAPFSNCLDMGILACKRAICKVNNPNANRYLSEY